MLTLVQLRIYTTSKLGHRCFTSLTRFPSLKHLPPSSLTPSTRSCLHLKNVSPYRKAILTFFTTSNNNRSDDSTSKLKQKTDNAKQVINKLKDVIPTHENIYTIPNMLTFSRLVSAPFIGYLITQHNYDVALGLFALAGFTDMLDGYIARRYNLKTVVGSIIDPAADKTLMTIMTITLGLEGVIPLPLAGVILGRDIGLVLAAFYYRYISLPAPKTFVRYWDFSIPSAEVRPTTISKVNTALQLLLMGSSLTAMSMGVPSAEIMTSMHWLVGTTTVWSGASYIYSKDAVRILNQEK
ncbi:CDP-alcohol phosphatidyltransferase-domain-containing protein [Chlamydoabsidia padenii]|nr:CDP-alcohol phosphatidyltransferase-domain-containing protein [Chlamydoabsidia padenii]